jgi:Putative lumazine-binding
MIDRRLPTVEPAASPHSAAGQTPNGCCRTRQEVTVLDVFQDIATVMVRSQPFTEYLHLGRFGDRWLIVNALYLVLA